MSELLSVQQMHGADRAAIAQGISGEALMEAAGREVARAILDRFGIQPTVVLCGPGNNGGDGFVIARHLKKAGAKVSLALLGDKAKLHGDAAIMAKRWRGRVAPLGIEVLDGAALVVDALFGAGLARPVTGLSKTVLAAAGDAWRIAAGEECLQLRDTAINFTDRQRVRLIGGQQALPLHLRFDQIATCIGFLVKFDLFRFGVVTLTQGARARFSFAPAGLRIQQLRFN